MQRVTGWFFLASMLCAPLTAQDEAPGSAEVDEKPYARVPREIVFQNDSQWEDNRWQQTDVGPFLAGSIQTSRGLVLKGLAIRVGQSQQAAVCYDTARGRLAAAWTGDFLKFDPRRFGVIRHPEAAGELLLSTDRIAGWARNGQFETDKSDQITRLPDDWFAFHGFYTHDQRVVLSYSVAGTPVLESPWYVEHDNVSGWVRSLEIGPSTQAMQMWLADAPAFASIVDAAGHATIEQEGRVLSIPPHRETVRVKVLLTRDAETIEALRPLAGRVDDLSAWIKSDGGRFSETLTTVGTTTESGGPYVIDTLTLPFENPWNALLFTAGHDFFRDGTAAICTLHGDVWTVSGIDRELKQLRWRRYATGLSQPLGLKIVDDRVYVINRTQLTRLHDHNGDGEADQYECFNNDNFTTPGSHDYVTCLETDQAGNFYYIHARTGVMKISPDGKRSESIADGFRNPNGMGVSPDGTVTAAPQQGQWTPQSSLIVVRQGGYYGYGGPRTSPERPSGWDLPMCFIPHTMDNSGGGQVWVQSDRWGPLAGRMLHLSYGQCRILLAVEEESSGGEIIQGGVIEFPTTPGDFESGIMRGRFRPQDGQLYVSGLRGWQTRAIRDGCFQRVRYTGGPVHLPTEVKTYQNGIQLTFTEPLDPDTATDPDNYFVSQWNYLWSAAYGSPDFSVERPQEQGRDEVAVVSATLLEDGRSVFLEMLDRRPVNQMVIDYALQSAAGQSFRGKYAHTINREPNDTFTASRIVRRRPAPLIDQQTVARLTPGLAARLTSLDSGKHDLRVLRLAAMRESVNAAPSVFLPPGSFSCDAVGTIKIPLSGDYEFRLEGAGQAEVILSGETILALDRSDQTSSRVRLRKGHNPIEIRYRSPSEGTAHWKLWWRGEGFGWEPLPPDALFHDAGDVGVQSAAELRWGRQLVANHRCVQCHRTELGAEPMVEIRLAAPDLGRVASRLNRDWIEQWLLDPASVHSDPSMPALLSENAKQNAADIAVFLTSSAAAFADPVDIDANLDGEVLFETLGCIACHHFDPISTDDPANRLSLHYASAKYAPGAIIDLLLNPQQHHASSRMPNFALTPSEAASLAAHVRRQSRGKINPSEIAGNLANGITAFADAGCQRCHALGGGTPIQSADRDWHLDQLDRGCLSDFTESDSSVINQHAPRFDWTDRERAAVRAFVATSLASLQATHPAETSLRLVQSLRCTACHDRDGGRAPRPLIIAEEGSGRLPEVIPSLTWLGEKFHADWNRRLLAGDLNEKPRPWLSARMPAFPAYAEAIASGLAIEHAIDPRSVVDHTFDRNLADIGQRLTLETGLDCRQCHAIGELQPRGDEKTQVALGINFVTIRDRMRYSAYHRFMLDPPRYDVNTKMIKLSENGVTTNLKAVYDGDAHQQFDAVWHYIQSLGQR
jgi:mono/diheme cytochrome c family protein